MSWVQGLAQRIRVVLRFSRVEQELDLELRDHFEREVRKQVEAGFTPEDARRRAALKVGHLDGIKEDVRDERGGRVLTDLAGDLRLSWRGVRRNPGFAVAVVLSLALGAGVTTALFSVVSAVLLRPLPYPDADRLHEIRVIWGEMAATLSAADFLRLREQATGVAEVAAYRLPSGGFTLRTDAAPEVIQGAFVSSELPAVLGVAPVIGRLPSGEAPEALIGAALWRRQFGGRPDVVGRGLTVDGATYTIVGVMPAGYNVPSQWDGEAWVMMPLPEPTRRGPFVLTVIGRLLPGVTAERAAARLTTTLLPVLRDRYRADTAWRYRMRALRDVVVGDVRKTLLLLFGAAGLVLGVAVVNVVSLLLARGTARGRELAVRASLGASRGRLARQLLAESGLLGLLAGVAGFALAVIVLTLTHRLAQAFVPRLREVRVDLAMVAFALALGTVAGLLAGAWPALRLPWRDLAHTLRDGGRGAGQGLREGRARRAVVVAEIALTLTVLAGAGLLVQSLRRLQAVSPGFQPDGVLSFRLALPRDPYRDEARLDAFLRTLEQHLRGLPGVSSVAYVSSLPPDRLTWSNNYTIEGRIPEAAGPTAVAQWIDAGPDYFAALRIPVRSGRVFTDADGAGSPRVAVVNQAFVQRHFPGADALGARFKGGEWDPHAAWTTIVGVVGDVPYAAGVWGGADPTVYLSYAQNLSGNRSSYVVIRTVGDPALLVPAVRRAVIQLDSGVPLRDVATMNERMHASTAMPRFRSLLFSLLAAIALLVAVTGIYGVLSYYISQRRRETAIRRALGAPAARIVGGVVASGLRLAAIGIAAGFAGALALTRSLAGILYGVSPSDAGTLLAAAAVLAAAALAASAIPAIRALRVDPVMLLREE